MKKMLVLGILSIFLLTSFNSIINADEENTCAKIIITYSFKSPVISKVNINNTMYDSINIDDTPCDGNPDEPMLPGKGSYILLPPNSRINNIVVNPGEMVSLGSGYLVEPAGESVPLSDIDNAPLPVPDEEIYSSTEAFPGTFFSEIGTYSCRGYTVLVLKLNPVQYIPASGELFYYPDLTVNVETVEETKDNSLFRGLQEDNNDVIEKVDNPSIGNMYMEELQSTPVSPFGYDFLIITSESLKSGFEPLAEAHNDTGLKTLISTVEYIYSHYPGVDNAEKIRNFIKYAYNNWHIEYVLLGGDCNIIPVKNLSAFSTNEFDQIPSDLYYAGLNGAWNNPETPKPINKDISIKDPGVIGSGSFMMDDPELNFTDYIVGTDSMQWRVLRKPNESGIGICKLTFNPSLDLSDERWLNFQAKYDDSQYAIFGGIILRDSIGRVLVCHPPKFFVPSTKEWKSYHFSIPKKNNFNYHAVKSISFCMALWWNMYPYPQEQDDVLKLDGIYFSDWCDELWGEPEEADLYAEVYLGRACVGNVADANNFVSKTLTYMNIIPEDPYLKKILLVGELLIGKANDKFANWGDKYMDELINICRKWGYKTVGIPSAKYSIDKLYDGDWEKYGWPEPVVGDRESGWPKSEIIDRINNNVYIINHLGHSNYEYNMKMNNSDVDSLNNNDLCFIYSAGCLAGGFDDPDCIAAHFTAKSVHGAFAGIWNSRYGWFKPTFNSI